MFCEEVKDFTVVDSLVLQKESNLKRVKYSSKLNESRSAFLRLVNVRWGDSGKFILNELGQGLLDGWS